MASAKDKMHQYLLEHVGEDVSRETLREVAGNIQDWQRSLRQLRQETGLDIVATKDGYILTSATPTREANVRGAINAKLRYAVLQRRYMTNPKLPTNSNNEQPHTIHESRGISA